MLSLISLCCGCSQTLLSPQDCMFGHRAVSCNLIALCWSCHAAGPRHRVPLLLRRVRLEEESLNRLINVAHTQAHARASFRETRLCCGPVLLSFLGRAARSGGPPTSAVPRGPSPSAHPCAGQGTWAGEQFVLLDLILGFYVGKPM